MKDSRLPPGTRVLAGVSGRGVVVVREREDDEDSDWTNRYIDDPSYTCIEWEDGSSAYIATKCVTRLDESTLPTCGVCGKPIGAKLHTGYIACVAP